MPGGENLTDEDLVRVNKRYRSFVRSGFFWLLAGFAVPFVLARLFSLIIGGGIGYTLASVTLIFSVPVMLLIFAIPFNSLKKDVGKLGFDFNDFNTARKNLADDKRAWGEPASRTVFYRIRCRKCRKISPWKEFTLTSCTEETLADKISDFKKKTLKKRKDFQSGVGFARYSLDRVCPECGAKQPKHPPRWYTIPAIIVIWFVVFTFFPLLVLVTSVKDIPDGVPIVLMFISVIVSVVFAVKIYLNGRRSTPIQFAFSEEEKNGAFPEPVKTIKNKTKALWYAVLGINAAKFLIVLLFAVICIVDLPNSEITVIIALLSASDIIFGTAEIVTLFRKKKIYPLFTAIVYAIIVSTFYITNKNGFIYAFITTSLVILLPALFAVPFIFSKLGKNDGKTNENVQPDQQRGQ